MKTLLNPTERNYAEATLAYDETTGKAVAFACWFYTFSTWTSKGGLYLEDLFVEEEYRGKGIGKMLFKMLGQICVDKDLARMDWVVLDWNESAKAVYKKMVSRFTLDKGNESLMLRGMTGCAGETRVGRSTIAGRSAREIG